MAERVRRGTREGNSRLRYGEGARHRVRSCRNGRFAHRLLYKVAAVVKGDVGVSFRAECVRLNAAETAPKPISSMAGVHSKEVHVTELRRIATASAVTA